MSEASVIDESQEGPITHEQLVVDLKALGLRDGAPVLVHSSLSKLGWVVGGAQAVVMALLDAVAPAGTLIVPAHSSGNSDPALWQNPPVPEDWWPVIRDHMPPYDPVISETRGMGLIVNMVRRWSGALRSDHPHFSFAAVGPDAKLMTWRPTPLGDGLGDQSPLGALYEADGDVLLLGVSHENNTSLHLCEVRADYPKLYERNGAAIVVNGKRQWAVWEQIAFDSDDFEQIGRAFEAAHPEAIQRGKVGRADAVRMSQRALVDFGVQWMEENRIGEPPDA